MDQEEMVMDIRTPIDAKVVFAFSDNGYEGEGKEAVSFIRIGEAYTIKNMFTERSSSRVELEEVPGRQFNTVLFENWEED